MKVIFKNSIIFLICEIVAKAVPFLMLPYLTRVLTLHDFGQLGLFTTFQAMFLVMINLSFDGAVSRYFYRYGTKNFKAVVSAAFLLITTLSLLIFLVLILLFKDKEILFFALIASSLQAFFNISTTVKQCQKKAVQYACYQLGFSILSLVTTIVIFHAFGYELVSRVWAILTSFIICIVIFILFDFKISTFCQSIAKLKLNTSYLIFFGLPLLFHQSSLYIKGQFDRVIVSNSYSSDVLAHYTAAFQIASVITVIVMALNKALVPFYFEACRNGKLNSNVIKKIFWIAFVFCLVPSIVLYFIPAGFYSFLLGAKYSDISTLVCFFSVGLSLQIPYLILVNFLFYRSKNKMIAASTFTSAVVHLSLLYFLKSFNVIYLPLALLFSNLTCIAMLYRLDVFHEEKV